MPTPRRGGRTISPCTSATSRRRSSANLRIFTGRRARRGSATPRASDRRGTSPPPPPTITTTPTASPRRDIPPWNTSDPPAPASTRRSVARSRWTCPRRPVPPSSGYARRSSSSATRGPSWTWRDRDSRASSGSWPAVPRWGASRPRARTIDCASSGASRPRAGAAPSDPRPTSSSTAPASPTWRRRTTSSAGSPRPCPTCATPSRSAYDSTGDPSSGIRRRAWPPPRRS
mmetsp:Transcript_30532/g.73725  ORF Transcript_30532/g.73725 Transcript_30532/m.73725 type:complete len:230 (+) Transcript_30532:540-1229(+)